MTWVHRAEPIADRHTCTQPMQDLVITVPKHGMLSQSTETEDVAVGTIPFGSIGDLWRCEDCGRLWRIGLACDACEFYGPGQHRGQCRVGTAWRPAGLWQRIKYRRNR